MKTVTFYADSAAIADPDDPEAEVGAGMAEYHGSDSVTGLELNLVDGQSAQVSDEKAAQLERDYPANFECRDEGRPDPVEEPPADEPPEPSPPTTPPAEVPEVTAPEPVPEPTVKSLTAENKRPELDAIATGLGIADAAALPTKQAVAKAIVKAIKAAS